MGCILCGRGNVTTLRMDVEFQDGTAALLDVDLCAECRAYLVTQSKRLVGVVNGDAIVDWQYR